MLNPIHEVWVIDNEREDGLPLPPAVDDDGTNNFLAWPSKEQAEVGLAYQKNTYGVDGVVRRLFPPEG